MRNPRTGSTDYSFDQLSPEALSTRLGKLRKAQPEWFALGVAGRVKALTGFAEALEKHHAEIKGALAADTGRWSETLLEVQAMRDGIRRWCRDAPELLDFSATNATSVPFVRARRFAAPYELAGFISPWNFPLLLSFVDAVPALLAGCAVAIKPSEITPRFIEPLLRAVGEVAHLRDVLGVFAGDGRLGAQLVQNVDVVCFTGSIATGRRVGEAAARSFIPAHLELGGKDPAIVTRNCDPARAAAAINWGGLANAGQSCLSIERVYVDKQVHDEFVEHLTHYTEQLTLNVEDIGQGQIGPIISEDQAGIIERHLADARSKGAGIACGGDLEVHGGVWCQPTVLTNVNHDMLVMTEESFAPILPVMAVDSEAEAVKLANDTQYGLSAAIFSDDEEQVARIASALDAGAISVNDASLTALIHEGEKQAFKASGLGGSRMGPASIKRFLRSKVLLINAEKAWDPWWYAPENKEE